MSKRMWAWAAGATAAMALAAAVGAAEPITDEALQAKIEAYQAKYNDLRTAGGLTLETVQDAAREALAGVEVDSLTMEQIKLLNDRRLLQYAELSDEAWERLDDFDDSADAQGAMAAAMRVQLAASIQDADSPAKQNMTDQVRSALKHPGTNELLRSENAGVLISSISMIGDDAMKEVAPDLLGAIAELPDDVSSQAVMALRRVFSGLAEMAPDLDKGAYDKARARAVTLATNAAAAAEDARQKKYFEDTVAFLDGAYAKGTLLGNAAPAVDIIWSSDTSIGSLNDLKGKVVVVDFWATWCGPCIASFPKVAELVEHYKGYDVAVVGITSIQGKHYPGSPAQPIDCTDDPEKEFGLMPGFMTDKNMTWPVLFSKQNVFNPDFGVGGIPHVAIIDATGKVRYNGMHPAHPLKEKTEKIDALLKEAGLPAPAPVESN